MILYRKNRLIKKLGLRGRSGLVNYSLFSSASKLLCDDVVAMSAFNSSGRPSPARVIVSLWGRGSNPVMLGISMLIAIL